MGAWSVVRVTCRRRELNKVLRHSAYFVRLQKGLRESDYDVEKSSAFLDSEPRSRCEHDLKLRLVHVSWRGADRHTCKEIYYPDCESSVMEQ